jgi:hypothetical protein
MPPLQQEKHRILLCTELTARLVAFSPALDYGGGGPTVWDISERGVNSGLSGYIQSLRVGILFFFFFGNC